MSRASTRARVTPVVLGGAALLILLDIIGALLRNPLGFPYSSMAVVSLVVYLAVGLIASWRGTFGAGWLAAILVGLLDGLFGPLFAWLVGSGPVGQAITEPRVFAYKVTIMTGAAAAAGLIGALAGSWLERRRTFRSTQVVPR